MSKRYQVLIDYLIKEGWIKPVEVDFEYDDIVYIIGIKTGRVYQERYTDSEEIKTMYELGMVFTSKEEAEKELAKMKARAKIRRFIEENELEKGDWYPIHSRYVCGRIEYRKFKKETVNEYGLAIENNARKLISACSDELKIVFGIE